MSLSFVDCHVRMKRFRVFVSISDNIDKCLSRFLAILKKQGAPIRSNDRWRVSISGASLLTFSSDFQNIGVITDDFWPNSMIRIKDASCTKTVQDIRVTQLLSLRAPAECSRSLALGPISSPPAASSDVTVREAVSTISREVSKMSSLSSPPYREVLFLKAIAINQDSVCSTMSSMTQLL